MLGRSLIGDCDRLLAGNNCLLRLRLPGIWLKIVSGRVLCFGGNLSGETRVLTTSVLMYTQMGQLELALGLAAVLVGLILLLAAGLTAIQQGGRA